ncbi:uncharacterized protein [Drosophila takahashii]|uniref:uncharacterized protein n=1 Tax=Drosophila takahashii TaxID=29030 RepID=UPI0038995A37
MTKRPIILPKTHKLTLLIAQHHHELCKHQNVDTMICSIRQTFWIPSICRLAKTIKTNCQLCKNLSAMPKPPLLGQLPMDRVAAFVRPFTYTGLDYLGPLLVAIGRRREKRWVALFTCMTTRAIHLELSKDLSSDVAIMCLKNFCCRRGVPKRIRSDQGTNFVGVGKEQWIEVVDAVAMESGRCGIEWVFNTPGNPAAGGAWERLVRSVKRILALTLKEKVPQVETLQDDPLTPNHFLLGCPNQVQTPVVDENVCLKKQWHIRQQLMHTFWKRWIQEYLPTLTRRTKWFNRVEPIQIGDVVLICDETDSRGVWRKGRIIEIQSAKDGQVRSATVKTATAVLRRPASKLAVLDVIGESQQAPIHGGRNVKKCSLLL